MSTPAEPEVYNMTVSLNVINHLGLNLYSNIPAVLSEAVANAWDADAQNVSITLDRSSRRITIADDGHGMTLQTINDRFLSVGYQRRALQQGRKTQGGRAVMGRKGIGKLSLFSIANEVKVYTVADERLDLFQMANERHAFAMKLTEIQAAIKDGKRNYCPEKLVECPDDLTKGTRIELLDLKRGLDGDIDHHLRKKLARRFSVIGPQHNFTVKVNGEPITIKDRGYFKDVQFLWTYGNVDGEILKNTSLFKGPRNRPNVVKLGDQTFEVNGWLGTSRYPKDLVIDGENLNRIVLMVRGRLAQEDLLGEHNDGRLFKNYVVGEINADFLDDDDAEDITTTSRQQIIRDDPRYHALVEFLRSELKNIANVWTELRRKKGVEEAQGITPIRGWLDSLKGDTRKSAERLFGRIHELPIDSEEDKKRIFKIAVLAFEQLRYKENLSELEAVDLSNLEAFTRVFLNVDDIEACLYHQIIASRLKVIEALNRKVARNELEYVIRDHIAEHLWLLDPGWERATDSVQVESGLMKALADLDKELTKEEKKGRFDIKYTTIAREHLIIELKRPDRRISKTDLEAQGDKYKRGLRKLLKQRDREDETISVFFLVGQLPHGWEEPKYRSEDVESLMSKGMRVLTYQQLLENAQRVYNEYLVKRSETGRIQKLLKEIDTADLLG